jgi:hypothetical protein
VVVQGPPTMLIRELLAELSARQDFSLHEGLEMDAAKSIPIRLVGTVMHASQAREEPTSWRQGSFFETHRRSKTITAEIMRSIEPPRQGRRAAVTDGVGAALSFVRG